MKKQLGMCILAPDLDCPEHTERRECSIDNDKCSFYSKSEQKPVEMQRYVRQPRWYEKYYK